MEVVEQSGGSPPGRNSQERVSASEHLPGGSARMNERGNCMVANTRAETSLVFLCEHSNEVGDLSL